MNKRFAKRVGRGSTLWVAAIFCVLCSGALGGRFSAAADWPAKTGDGRTALTGSAPQTPRLWRALPTRNFATLGEGTVHGRYWGVYAFLKINQGHNKPCIENVVERTIGRSISIQTGSPSCGLLAPARSTPVVSETALSNVGGVILGMTVAPEVRQLELQLKGQGTKAFEPRLLSHAQAKKAHLRQFRYIAVGLPKAKCLLQSTGLGATGSTLFESAKVECSL